MGTDPLLRRADCIAGVVDHRGRPATRSDSGGWAAALFIIGVEVGERFAYYGISSNLISYLTGPLRRPTAAAAAAVNTWSGVSMMFPLLGAFVADSYLGRYRTIAIASALYTVGLAMLTLSAVLPTFHTPKGWQGMDSTSSPPTRVQVAAFYLSLYLAALAQGGHKPCVQAFGADQFDQSDPKESKSRASFFNWWYFGLCGSTGISIFALSYVQDQIGWGLGFGIPCIAMGLASVVFLLGTRSYRYYLMDDEIPFTRIYRAFAALIRSRRISSLGGSTDVTEAPLPQVSDQSMLSNDSENLYARMQDGDACELEEAKDVLRLIPIWMTCLIYAVVCAQISTFFTKQGSTLDRRIGKSFEVPPAALMAFVSVAIVVFVPMYDRILVPLARKFTGLPSGLTMLQRIGTGLLLSVILMVTAALVETRRLKIARDFGLVDRPEATVPMSFWWLVPQYLIFGMADVFALIGLQELFYDQVPDSLRSLGLALYLSILGLGSLISGVLVSFIDRTTGSGGESWLSTNLNRAHLDYFYWLLAVASAFGLVIYLYFAQSFVYKNRCSITL